MAQPLNIPSVTGLSAFPDLALQLHPYLAGYDGMGAPKLRASECRCVLGGICPSKAPGNTLFYAALPV